MKNIKRLLSYLKKYKLWAFLAPTLIILEVVMELLLPNIMSNIINIGVANNDTKYIIVNVLIMLGLTIVGVAGGIGSSYYAAKASESVAFDLRKEVFAKISRLSFLNLEKLKPGHLLTILTNDIATIGSLIMLGLRLLFRVPIIFIGSLIMALFISPKLTLILVVLIPIVFIVVFIILRKAFPYFNKMQDCVDEVNSNVRENVGGIRVIKSFTMEDKEIDKFNKVNKNLLNTTLKGVKMITISMPVMMFSINLATLLILWFGGNLVIEGNLLVGDIVAFVQYTSSILSSLLMASMVIMMSSKSIVSAERIFATLDADEDFKDKETPLVLEKLKGKVEFRNVSFAYEGGTGDAVLKNLNFIVNPGEKIAIVGSIGSGKTSLVNLIPRFFDATSGEVLIDDVDVKDFSLEFLRKSIGFSFQQTFIFSKTIKENIGYGDKNATDEQIEHVANISAASDFINKKEKKYNYVLEQRGVNLSGGQKQRISIARSLLVNPKILILDDSTSAVDVKTDKQIKKSLKEEYKCTTFMIVSRIASALDADKVIVLEDGYIVGYDTPDKLLKSNKFYQDIYYSQLKEEKHGK